MNYLLHARGGGGPAAGGQVGGRAAAASWPPEVNRHQAQAEPASSHLRAARSSGRHKSAGKRTSRA